MEQTIGKEKRGVKKRIYGAYSLAIDVWFGLSGLKALVARLINILKRRLCLSYCGEGAGSGEVFGVVLKVGWQ